MTRIETEAKIEELEEQLLDAQDELKARPTNTIEVEVIREITVSNSDIGGENLGALFGALANVQAKLKATKKGASGHGYNYSDLESVIDNYSPLTSKEGLSVVQVNVSKIVGKTVFTGVKTILGHKDGGWISGEIYVPIAKTKMNSLVQMAGVSISYLRRYGVQSILGMASTDNDGSDK